MIAPVFGLFETNTYQYISYIYIYILKEQPMFHSLAIAVSYKVRGDHVVSCSLFGFFR